ncbi:MAG: hypothetical protein H5T74_05540 [Actinobacteria bacterium]|nr:hypothetical protein [Actinomycetota bacterium]MDI6830777.1 hypothetical protein [Actinomycetota bacterium]
MSYLSSALYVVGPISVAVLLLLLAAMGKRLGQALELPPYYRLYYVSFFFFVAPLPAAWILLLTGAWGLPDPEPLTGLIIKIAVASIPMGLAITFALIASARYWGWIWGELARSRRRKENEGEG